MREPNTKDSTPPVARLQHRIQLARKLTGLNQVEFAAKVGVSPRAVQKWEAGETEPRGASLLVIAQIIEKPMEWFFEEVAA